MNIEERVTLFSEQIMCCAEIYTWRYNNRGNIVRSNCPKEELLDEIFHYFADKNSSIEYALSSHKPLILNIPGGLIWCLSADNLPGEEHSVYAIGPVRSTEASIDDSYLSFNALAKDLEIPADRIQEMRTAIRSLPVVMSSLMYQLTLMLHCTVTGEQLGLSDIIHQQKLTRSAPEEPMVNDRYRTWNIERTMLNMVRKGDLGYSKAFNQASSISRGVHMDTADNIRQAKTSVIVFTSLCTRAAIEGGLSPDEAYTLGDTYISSVEKAQKISEIAAFSYAMYSDFTERVHKRRISGTEVIAPIRNVCDYIELHADEPFTNRDLAKRAGYSEQYLRRKFSEEMNISLPDYIRMIRLERAKNLLANSDLSIPAIADQLQFCSRAHFSDCFTKYTGYTPAKYRKQHHI